MPGGSAGTDQLLAATGIMGGWCSGLSGGIMRACMQRDQATSRGLRQGQLRSCLAAQKYCSYRTTGPGIGYVGAGRSRRPPGLLLAWLRLARALSLNLRAGSGRIAVIMAITNAPARAIICPHRPISRVS